MTTRKIKNHKLDLTKTLPYFLNHIKCGKTLSERVSEKIDFTKLEWKADADTSFADIAKVVCR